MPKAITTSTMAGATAPVPTRRQLVGGSILAAACGAAFAGAVVLPNPSEASPTVASPDAHLLALCAKAMRLDLGSGEADDAGLTDKACDMLTEWFVVAQQIADTPARTSAGIQAKAVIVRHLMTPASVRPDDDQTKWDEAGVYGPLTWSLVNDLAAVA